MTDAEIEECLKRLGRATEPRASIAPAMMEQVGKLAIPGEHRRAAGPVLRVAAALIAAAACVGALLWALRGAPQTIPPHQIVVLPDTRLAGEPDDSIPRMVDYQRAYSQSPLALEALLQQWPRGEVAGGELVRAGDVFRTDLSLYP